MSETNDTNNKVITTEFINTVKKYIEIDDKILEYKNHIKELNNTKKENEEYILNYLQSIDENTIDIQNGGKLIRNTTRTKTPIKKELIQQSLSEIIGDASKATNITTQILNSRQTIEKVTLKRTSK